MPILPESAGGILLPKFRKVKQLFPDQRLENIPEAIRAQFQQSAIRDSLSAEKTAAILVGSRGIAELQTVVKAVVEELVSLGVRPFIVPAMGSHGGGVAEEQRQIIEHYGVTEEFMGVPIKSSMETVIIGETSGGVPIHVDHFAAAADFIIPVGRVKAHTDFDGPIESGLCKMLSIGIGKHNGCSRLHQEGFPCFPELLPQIASIIMDRFPVPFGVAIIENAHEHVHTVELVPGKEIVRREPELLKLSKSLMPRLCFDHLDVLIVDQIGKDVTGAGMDPNITGRVAGAPQSPYYTGPSITRIVINRLSEATAGNATGMGVADFVTRRLYESIDMTPTYTNLIASCVPENARIPMVMKDEEEALLAALVTCRGIDKNHAKVVRIKDTLHLTEIEVSESLIPYCLEHPEYFELVEEM